MYRCYSGILEPLIVYRAIGPMCCDCAIPQGVLYGVSDYRSCLSD